MSGLLEDNIHDLNNVELGNEEGNSKTKKKKKEYQNSLYLLQQTLDISTLRNEQIT